MLVLFPNGIDRQEAHSIRANVDWHRPSIALY